MIAKYPFLGLITVVLLALCGCSNESQVDQQSPPQQTGTKADAIFFGGHILTIDDGQPTVEAIAISNGSIIGVGTLQQLEPLLHDDTRRIDLNGSTLMPGFIDSHSHLTMTAVKQAVVNLDPPPAGPADSISSIQQLLQKRLQEHPPAKGDWLIGWGYDHVMLSDQRHPNRSDLDKVSSNVPIVVIHFSSHQVVVNSAGLALLGINETTKNPPGGMILREPGSDLPNGILQEAAMLPVIFPILNKLMTGGVDLSKDDSPTEAAFKRINAAIDTYASEGFTTATEMAGSPDAIEVLRALSERQPLKLDVIAVAMARAHSSDQVSQLYSPDYKNRFRVGGVKFVLDGGSPGRSAYLLEPYHKQLTGEDHYRGYPHYPDQEQLNELVDEHARAGNPLYVHALGDAAVAQAITALEPIGKSARSQLIHVQQATEEQLDQINALGAAVTFQVAHNFYFGDFHRQEIYGPQRTARLNPARSAMSRGISVTLHHDSPVHPVDQMMLIWAAVNRVTRSGQVIGEDQRISVRDALKASTINAAHQFFEGDRKGSLEVGKLADLVILSENPLTLDPMAIRDIEIMETIKEGQTIFRQ